MTLNGWHRLLIVIATAWAIGVIGLAALEFEAKKHDTGDGFVTCWEPYESSPNAPASKDFCGVLPRREITPTGFYTLLPGTRYLNASRFAAVLFGPLVSVGLLVLTIFWILGGFRSAPLKSGHSEPNTVHRPLPPARPELPSQSYAQAWLHRLPRRWARNAAIGGGALAALAAMPFLSRGDGILVALMLVGFAVVTLGMTGAGYLCGRWAQYSLKAPFMLSPASAVARITSNWLTGAILLGAMVLACDVLFGWRKTTPLFEGGVSLRDLGYLTGFFGTWMLGGYLTAVASRRGLRKATDADRKPSSARTSRPPAPHGDSLQHEHSIG